VGHRELLRSKNVARAALYLVLGSAIGCGRSVKNDHDGDGSSGMSTGGSAHARGGSSGSSGSGGSSGQGGASEGGSSQGGSSEGGTSQGGSAGGGGEAGDELFPTRVFLQTGDTLVAVDPETLETRELCPSAATSVAFDFIDWVNERALFTRESGVPTSTEVLRVALDGSECMTLYRYEETTFFPAFSPAAGARIVLPTAPTARGELGRPSGDDPAEFIYEFGLSGLSLDGSLELITPNGVNDYPRIVGDHVLFERRLEDGTFDLFSALSDGSSLIAPVPVEGEKWIGAVRGNRLVVNASSTGDVYAVDADGGNLVVLAAAPATGFGFVGNQVIVARFLGAIDFPQADLSIVDENGGELTPLASSSDPEIFRGSAGERVIYERGENLYSVRLDGSDTRPIAEIPDAHDYLLASLGEHIVYGSVRDNSVWSYFYSAADGSDRMTLLENASGFAAVAGERVILYVGTLWNFDVVSVPLTGGDPYLLSDGAGDDTLVVRLGTLLIIQRGGPNNEGEVVRIDADGSRGALLAPSARYLGSVSEACGAHRRVFSNPACPE
jgi:hypothetical protein